MEEPVYLFVYGTLRKEYGSPFYKQYAEEMEWVGRAKVNGRLYDIGEYPGAIPHLNGKHSIVNGDVIRLKDPEKFIQLLDQYENYDQLNPLASEYVRENVSVEMENGEHVSAWIYWYSGSVTEKKRIRHKDYLNYLKKKLRYSGA